MHADSDAREMHRHRFSSARSVFLDFMTRVVIAFRGFPTTYLYEQPIIEDVCAMMPSSNRSVTPSEVKKIINSFKNNKAQDCRGLAAEHLKFSPDSVSFYLADIMNYILRTGYVPRQLKEGVLTPVLKKRQGSHSSHQLSRNNGSLNLREAT